MLNAVKLYDVKIKIIRLFENKDIKPNDYSHNAKSELDEHDKIEEFKPQKSEGVEKSEQKFDKSIGERTKLRRQKSNEFSKMIIQNDKIISEELFKNHFFNFKSLFDMQEKLRKTSNVQKNKELVREIQSGLFDLKNEIEKMFKDEIDIEKPDVIVYTAERILDFNNQNQEGQGLKTLTPEQMLSRLPISLA